MKKLHKEVIDGVMKVMDKDVFVDEDVLSDHSKYGILEFPLIDTCIEETEEGIFLKRRVGFVTYYIYKGTTASLNVINKEQLKYVYSERTRGKGRWKTKDITILISAPLSIPVIIGYDTGKYEVGMIISYKSEILELPFTDLNIKYLTTLLSKVAPER